MEVKVHTKALVEYIDAITEIYQKFSVCVAGGFCRTIVEDSVWAGDECMKGFIDIDLYIIGDTLEKATKIYHEIKIYMEKGALWPKFCLHNPHSDDEWRTWAIHPAYIVESFDLSVARMWLEFINNKLYLRWLPGEDPVEDIINRGIRLLNIISPVKEVVRISRYLQKGYKIDDATLIRLFLKWENLSEANRIKFINAMLSKVRG